MGVDLANVRKYTPAVYLVLNGILVRAGRDG